MCAGRRARDVDLIEALGSELVVHFTLDARRIRAEGATGSDTEAASAAHAWTRA